LEKIRRKERRSAKQSTQADYVPDGNITHPRQNKGHTDKHSPPSSTIEEADNISRTTYPTGEFKRPTPIDKVTEGSSTKWTAHQPLYGGTSGRPLTAKGNRPPPINVTLQDPKDTVTLVQDTLKIRNFHIKRIHAGKHVLYLQNLSKYKKAIEILITTNTAFYTYTPKSQK
jgi:hypothetical protein